MFTIDHNVPIPPSNPHAGGHRKARQPYLRYPFAEMKVGDSFLVPAEIAPRASSAAGNYAKANKPMKFLTRQTPEGLRIWRTQ